MNRQQELRTLLLRRIHSLSYPPASLSKNAFHTSRTNSSNEPGEPLTPLGRLKIRALQSGRPPSPYSSEQRLALRKALVEKFTQQMTVQYREHGSTTAKPDEDDHSSSERSSPPRFEDNHSSSE